MHHLRALPLFVLLMAISAAAMFVPAAHALALGDYPVARAFGYSGVLFGILTALLALSTAANRPGNLSRDHLLTMVATFTVLPLMLAVPFVQAVPGTGYFKAWWEMVSSLTTTGATLFAPRSLAPSLHLWRALVGWMGGYFILVMAIAVLAPMRLGGFEVFFAGATGEGGSAASADRIADPRARILRAAQVLAPAWFGLTLVLWVALLVAGDPPLLALIHAMSTLATSGITPLGSFAEAPSGLAGEVLIFAFLLLALSRRLWPGAGELRASARLRDDPELRLAAVLVLGVALLLFLRHWLVTLDIAFLSESGRLARALWGAVFTALSFLTTTGFESSGWLSARVWSGLDAPGLLLAGLAIFGGGVATTAGGVKLLRVYALLRHGERELDRLVHPSSIGGGGIAARRLRREGAYIAWVFFMLFAISIAVTMLAVSLAGLGFEPATLLSIAALSNAGPLAVISGQGNDVWAQLAPSAKAVLAAAMVLGRLETLALIALFNPEFWRR
ncbi:TrkH family potassium uptake protein [Phaeovulum sp.]|uniref:TrkH family potassium uptake protein n=1 Tax=Phaeovulum sp. TaxID=2934796 RepID=UPI00272F2FE1|nr:potassium transporter TrkG [Phaeovulum sp.]MDP1668297.1 potassium transporter TrkG [Phaeovulum sp.]MDZ4118145.1 potassium transporter TrkG [Phaeovulum sp.]